MRIGAALIYNNGKFIQSYGWKYRRILGNVSNAIKFLDEYRVDEISIINAKRGSVSIDEIRKDVEQLSMLNSYTPISIGGGIRNKQQVDLYSKLPIERLILSSLMIDCDEKTVGEIIAIKGRQAIQALVPFKVMDDRLYVYNSGKMKFEKISSKQLEFMKEMADEIIIYDVESEGHINKFDMNNIKYFNIPNDRLIISGGVGKDTVKNAKEIGIASVLIENRVLHKEGIIKEI